MRRGRRAAVALLGFVLLFAGCTSTIEGDVTLNGDPLPGVEVTFAGPGSTTVVTDADGHYLFPPLIAGPAYTFTPSLEGFVFGPASRTEALPLEGLRDRDFVAAVDGTVPGGLVIPGDPQALVVTRGALAPAFRRLARLHTATGIPTGVVTVEEICAGACDDGDPRNDTAAAVKAFLRAQPGLRYALLGGDVEDVPSREVADCFHFALTVLGIEVLVFEYLDQVFLSDYYYADFADWDPDGDGVYAEEGEEVSDYRPEIAVSRLPVSSAAEVEAYREKLVRYLTATPAAAAGRAVWQAGVFTSFRHPFTGDRLQISSAYYGMDAGRTLDLLAGAYEVTRQFEAANPVPDPEALIYEDAGAFAAAHRQLLEEGVHVVRYADHGTATSLAPGIDADDAHALVNDAAPVILSETCHGGGFAHEDSAGEQVVKAPAGGAIAYLGQGAVGNSLLGANQLLDEVTRYLVTEKSPILADACAFAHRVLPDVDDTFTFPLSLGGFPFFDVTQQVITEDNRNYAQKASVLLGDHLIPVWNEPRGPAPELEVARRDTAAGIVLTLTPADVLSHAPTVHADGVPHGFDTVGTSFELALAEAPAELVIGFPSTRTQYFYREMAVPEPR